MSAPVSIRYSAVEGLAGELAALAAQLAEEPPRCRAAAASARTAVDGDVGWRAGAAMTAWGSLTGLLAEQCAGLAGTLRAAVASYRAVDWTLADAVRPGRVGATPVPR
jgi:hypothetical protein